MLPDRDLLVFKRHLYEISSDKLFNFIYFFTTPVDKLLSNEDGGGIFDDPPAITESVLMPPDHGDDEDDFDNLQSRQ